MSNSNHWKKYNYRRPTGETVEHKSITETDLTEQQVDHVIKQFEGTIEQIPPMYSSVKVNGKRLYEYARNNETVERPIRQATIKLLNVHHHYVLMGKNVTLI